MSPKFLLNFVEVLKLICYIERVNVNANNLSLLRCALVVEW